jgi:membrane complex biogenesis BtpA family protein
MLFDPNVKIKNPVIIGAIYIPPFLPPVADQVDEALLCDIEQFICEEAAKWAEAGAQAVYLQNSFHFPYSSGAAPETLTILTRFALAVKRRVKIGLGLVMEEYDPAGMMAIARAVPLDFLRVKVYVGAMVKADGVIPGCAGIIQRKRWELGLTRTTTILADVYDRTGKPLAALPLGEMCRQAVKFAHADALILTGFSFDESLEMLEEARKATSGSVPLFLGGSSRIDNLDKTFAHAQGCILYSSVVETDRSAPAGWQDRVNKADLQAYMDKVRQFTF